MLLGLIDYISLRFRGSRVSLNSPQACVGLRHLWGGRRMGVGGDIPSVIAEQGLKFRVQGLGFRVLGLALP